MASARYALYIERTRGKAVCVTLVLSHPASTLERE